MAWLMNEDRKWSLRCTGHFGAASEAMLAFCDEEGAEPAGKALDLPVDRSNPHL